MGWFQCSCGFAIEMLPRIGETITSVSHLHSAARLEGSSTIVRMKEIAGPARESTVARAVGDQANRHSTSVGEHSHHSTQQVTPHPQRWLRNIQDPPIGAGSLLLALM